MVLETRLGSETKITPPADKLLAREAGKTGLVATDGEELLHDALAKTLGHGMGRPPASKGDGSRRAMGCLGRGDILGARNLQHEKEETRSIRPLTRGRNGSRFWPGVFINHNRRIERNKVCH